jgi:phosphoribosyl-ATP pyrophosphohydrolase
MSEDVLARLAAVVHGKRSETAERSYTRQLLDQGVEKCARKFGEESLETVIAALSGNETALKQEAADVLYHLLVLLECRGVAWRDVLAVLEQRTGTSGLAEKAARNPGSSQ